MNSLKTKRLTTSSVMLAIAVAVSFICGLIPFLNLTFGGGFTLASMLPIVVIAYMYGTKWGLLTSFAYAILQMLLSFNTVYAFFLPNDDGYAGSIMNAVLICLIDYVIAYVALGFGGVFRNKIKNKTLALVLGVILALSLRYIAHIISGYIFFGGWAERYFGQEGFALGERILNTFSGNKLAFIYTLVYNGSYMIPEIIITSIIAVPVSRIPQIKKY